LSVLCSFLLFVVHKKHHMLGEFLYRGLRRFAKGFALGYMIKCTLSLLALLIKTRFSLSRVGKAVSRIVVGDPIRFGIFLGSLLSLFESVMRVIRYLKGWQ